MALVKYNNPVWHLYHPIIIMSRRGYNVLKGIIPPKSKMIQRFPPPQCILGVSDIPLQTNTFRVIFHMVLSVPVCIIAVNGAPVSESQKSIHPSQNYSTDRTMWNITLNVFIWRGMSDTPRMHWGGGNLWIIYFLGELSLSFSWKLCQ